MIFDGSTQYGNFTGITSTERLKWRITLTSDYPDPDGGDFPKLINTLVGGGTAWIGTAPSTNIQTEGGVDQFTVDTGSDPVGVSQWNPTTAPSGSIIAFRLSTFANYESSMRLCADDLLTTEFYLAVGISLIEIYADDNTTLLHSFDLDSPSSATINDSVGSAVLTLVGFTFGGTVTDVNTDEVIDDAETSNTLTVSGFGDDINEVKLISGAAETDVLNLAGSGDDYTFDNIDIAALSSITAGAPLTSANNVVQIEASDGTDTDTLIVISNPKAGWAVQEITSAVKTAGSVFEGFTGTIPDTSQVLYPTAENTTVSATGAYASDNTTTNVTMLYWDATSEQWEPFTGIINVAANVAVGNNAGLNLSMSLGL